MGKPYSLDLRERIVSYVVEGHSARAAAQVFGVSASTAVRLAAAHRCAGDVVADRGYDARAILDLIAARGGRGHIPTQRDRKVQRSVDPELYRRRNLAEPFFNKLKHFRKIATRYEKTARNYLSAVLIVCSRIWMRSYEPAS